MPAAVGRFLWDKLWFHSVHAFFLVFSATFCLVLHILLLTVGKLGQRGQLSVYSAPASSWGRLELHPGGEMRERERAP